MAWFVPMHLVGFIVDLISGAHGKAEEKDLQIAVLRQSFESRGFSVAKMRETAIALVAAHDDREYNERFLSAFSLARAVQQMTRNAGAVGLLAVELPIIGPSRTDEYLEEAERALCAFTLMLYYGALKSWDDTFGLEIRDDDMRESQQNIDFYQRIVRAYRED